MTEGTRTSKEQVMGVVGWLTHFLGCVRTDLQRENEVTKIFPKDAVELQKALDILETIAYPQAASAPEPIVGQAVTDGMIVAIYAGDEGAQFKLLRHNAHGMLSEVRRPWAMRNKYRPATYDELLAACPHDWLSNVLCDHCSGASQPPGLNHDESVMLLQDAEDAKRYRFLREPNHAIVYARDPDAWGHNTPGHIRYNTPEQLDAAIDAAISSGPTKGEG
jgi:hypothetical protein